jgi:hypothetical protein
LPKRERALGCEKIFSEQVSSISKRPELDRLARSVQDLWKLVEDLDRKDVHLRVLDIGIDTSAPTGRLILSVLGGKEKESLEPRLPENTEAESRPRSRRREMLLPLSEKVWERQRSPGR